MKRCKVLWKVRQKKDHVKEYWFSEKWRKGLSRKKVDDSLDAQFGKRSNPTDTWRQYKVKL